MSHPVWIKRRRRDELHLEAPVRADQVGESPVAALARPGPVRYVTTCERPRRVSDLGGERAKRAHVQDGHAPTAGAYEAPVSEHGKPSGD
jgi:hypothetical protein